MTDDPRGARARVRHAPVLAALALLVVVAFAGACSDDDASDGAVTSDAEAGEAPAPTEAPSPAPPVTSGEFAEYCGVAQELVEARRTVAAELGTDPSTADPEAVEGAVTSQVAAMEAAAAAAPPELQDDYATALANLQELTAILEGANWDYAAALEDAEFAQVATDAEASVALNTINTFDIGQCGLLP